MTALRCQTGGEAENWTSPPPFGGYCTRILDTMFPSEPFQLYLLGKWHCSQWDLGPLTGDVGRVMMMMMMAFIERYSLGNRPLRMGTLPAGKGVGGEAAMDQRNVWLIVWVRQVREVLPQLSGVQLALWTTRMLCQHVLFFSIQLSLWLPRMPQHVGVDFPAEHHVMCCFGVFSLPCE